MWSFVTAGPEQKPHVNFLRKTSVVLSSASYGKHDATLDATYTVDKSGPLQEWKCPCRYTHLSFWNAVTEVHATGFMLWLYQEEWTQHAGLLDM
jgi:hypothetical protein